jgi:hypothetical protein
VGDDAEVEEAALCAKTNSYLSKNYLLSIWLFIFALFFVVHRFMEPVDTLDTVH